MTNSGSLLEICCVEIEIDREQIYLCAETDGVGWNCESQKAIGYY